MKERLADKIEREWNEKWDREHNPPVEKYSKLATIIGFVASFAAGAVLMRVISLI